MPELRPETQAERAQHLLTNTRPRRNSDVINQPDDALEGGGDMVTRDRNGNPLMLDGSVAFKFGNLESPDGWYPYLAQGEGVPTKQASAPLPITRDSFLVNQPIFLGDPPPAILVQAKIPRPEAPILVAETVGTEGFPASTEANPYFLLHTYAVGPEGKRRHSLPSPAVVVPPVQNGQSIKDILPTQVPQGITHVGIWQTGPGTSTSVSPGPFWLQREVEVEHYNPGFYDLTGPFRAGTASRKLPTRNETQLLTPGRANLRLGHEQYAAKPGSFFGRVTWTDANGESLPGPLSNTVTIVALIPAPNSTDDNPELIAGFGRLYFTRPSNPQPGATGWRQYVYTAGEWYVVYDARNELGNEKPYPLSTKELATTGWSSSGDNEYSKFANNFLVQRDLPVENTSGFESPTEAPDQPVVFGTVRPPAGLITGQITETLRGKESPPSPTTSITITSNQVPRLIRQDRVNRIPNGEFTEIGAGGLPLGHTVVGSSGSVLTQADASAGMDGADLVLKTPAATSGTTPSNTTMLVKVNRAKDWRVEALIAAENPSTGAFQGNAEVVLEELDGAGAVTQTVLGTLSSVGKLKVDTIIHAYGTGGTVVWKVGTVQARVLARYSGATKNLQVRITYKVLYDRKHKPPRRKRGPWEIGDFDVPDSSEAEAEPELPPGDDSGAIPPPEDPPPPEPIPGVSPLLVAHAAPDRPSSAGTALEAKHTFETGFPAGWDQVVSGATLTRDATSQLSGTYSLRSYKATP